MIYNLLIVWMESTVIYVKPVFYQVFNRSKMIMDQRSFAYDFRQFYILLILYIILFYRTSGKRLKVTLYFTYADINHIYHAIFTQIREESIG